jgi:hypothetical protein
MRERLERHYREKGMAAVLTGKNSLGALGLIVHYVPMKTSSATCEKFICN